MLAAKYFICIPFAMLIAAHAKLFGARLHTSAHHQTVARLKDVQRARDARVRHRAHKDWDVLGQTGDKRWSVERWHTLSEALTVQKTFDIV